MQKNFYLIISYGKYPKVVKLDIVQVVEDYLHKTLGYSKSDIKRLFDQGAIDAEFISEEILK